DDVALWTVTAPGAAAETVMVRGQLRTTSIAAARNAALAGAGIALVPRWLVAADLAAGQLRSVLAGCGLVPDEVHIIYRAEFRKLPRVMTLVQFVRKELPAMLDARC